MQTARRYLAKEIYRASAVVIVALVGLFTFFALIEDLDHVGTRFTLASLFLMQALALPARLYELLPIGLLIGAILALSGMAQRNELVILRASGISGLRLLRALWLLTLPLMGGALLLSEVITPAAELKASETSLALLGRAQGGRLQSGYWFKEADGKGGFRILNINQLQANGTVSGITLYEFREGQELATVSTAETGRFDSGSLTLMQVEVTEIADDALSALASAQPPERPVTRLQQIESRALQTSLTPERLLARVLTPDRMSILDLNDYIDYLRSNHLQTDRQVIALWRKVAYPFTLLVMITIAAPIGLLHTRRGGVGSKVFIGILLGVGFFFANQLALNLGMLSGWAPWVTALMPSAAALATALLALLLMENHHRVLRLLHTNRLWARPAA